MKRKYCVLTLIVILVISSFTLTHAEVISTNTTFNPKATATREEAVDMLIKTQALEANSLVQLHGFYSLEVLSNLNRINELDAVSYVKRELTYTPETSEVHIKEIVTADEDFTNDLLEDVITYSKEKNIPQYLTIHGDIDLTAFLSNDASKTNAMNKLLKLLVSTPEEPLQYDGIILDFEKITLESKEAYLKYLESLSAIMQTLNKDFYVTLRWPGSYTVDDLKRLEAIADGVIVILSNKTWMGISNKKANTNKVVNATPFLSIDELYYALKILTNEKTGFTDRSKLIFQVDVDTCQWQVHQDSLMDDCPLEPTYQSIYEAIQKYDVDLEKMPEASRASYVDDKGLQNYVWFENEESIRNKIKLINIFGVHNIYLGDASTIPNYAWNGKGTNPCLNIWDSILSQITTTESFIEPPLLPVEEKADQEKTPKKEDTVKTISLQNTLTAKTAILMDAKTGDILYEKDMDTKRPPASMTKIMMMYIVMEDIHSGKFSWEDKIVASSKAANTAGKSISIEAGDTFSLKTLFTSMIVESGCDATVALAEYLEGSEKAYVVRANAKAKELGLTNTHYVNSHGLNAPGHYSTARDVATLAMKLITAYPDILNISSIIQKETYRNRNGMDTQYRLDTTNDLLKTYKWATGLKTGFHNQAGYCLCATAEKNGQVLISVVMGSASNDTRVDESKILLEAGFNP